MPKVVFCFAGTGDSGDDYADDLELRNKFNVDVIRIYFRGCQHDNVGGGYVFTDLEIVANKIKNAFNTDKTMDLAKLKEEMGDGICLIKGPVDQQKVQIESIGLQGFSRGAVTTFAVAKKLDSFDIPMDIIANQPVPGPGIFSKYNDLTACKNIRSATTLIASHNLENSFAHNHFFHQMVTQFPPQTHAKNLLMPHQAHLEWFHHSVVPSHIGKQFVQSGYARASRFIDFDQKIKQQYTSKDIYFTPKEFSQKVFSNGEPVISKDHLYLAIIKEQAQKIMADLALDGSRLNDEQASAIVALGKQKTITLEEQKNLITFIVADSANAKKLTQIMNRTHEIIEFLSHVTSDTSGKSKAIKEQAPIYQRDIFLKTYEYLQNMNPSKEESREFCKQIDQVQSQFSSNALSIDRGIMRKAMQIITNTILHATGLFLIFNTINKAVTGNWFLFRQTRSEAEMGKVAKEVKKLVDDIPLKDKVSALKEQLITEKQLRSPELAVDLSQGYKIELDKF